MLHNYRLNISKKYIKKYLNGNLVSFIFSNLHLLGQKSDV